MTMRQQARTSGIEWLGLSIDASLVRGMHTYSKYLICRGCNVHTNPCEWAGCLDGLNIEISPSNLTPFSEPQLDESGHMGDAAGGIAWDRKSLLLCSSE